MAEAAPLSLGRYTIRAELGRGGFATAYRAFDSSLEREVALKVLHPQLVADRTFAERFRKEARALAGMRHPNIITVYEVGEADGRLYIAMELANGSSLAQTLASRGRLTWNETLAILKPVCDALDYAHAQGIVHRDLKPANILLDKDRGALLTDFGFARIMGESSTSMSLSGGILGTPAYVAPEVWELEAAKPAADIYALGCVVYEMLTGQVRFAGKTPMQIMRAHDQGPQWSLAPAWSAEVPAGVEAVLRQALARQPDARYPSASALWQALNDLEADAQASREKIERAATAAQWRTEVEAALAAGQWSAARMAVGRWLAVTPDDPAAQAARAEIERRQVAAQADSAAQERARREAEERRRQAAQRQAQEEAARKTGQDQIRQAREAAVLAEQKARQQREAQVAPVPYTPAPTPKRRIPTWVWIGGGAALLACVIFGLAGFALFRSFSSTAIQGPDSTKLPESTQPPEATQASDATLPPTDAPVSTATLVPAATPLPTDAPASTATLVPAATPLPTATVVPATVMPALIHASAATPGPTRPTATMQPGTLLDFEEPVNWRRGNQPNGTLTQSTAQAHSGTASARLDYSFPTGGNDYVVFINEASLAGQPNAIGAWVAQPGGGSGHFLNMWIRDAGGQVWQVPLGRVGGQGWTLMTGYIATGQPWPWTHISGPDNGRVDYPISFYALVLDDNPDTFLGSGTIYIDDITTWRQDTVPTPASAGPVLQPTPVKPTPGSGSTVANEPRAVTLDSPVNGTQFKSPVITFKWSGGALQPSETFLVEIIPTLAEKKGNCVEESDYGNAGHQFSPPLTDHEWTTDISQLPPGKAKPCAGRIEWRVHVRDANGNTIQSTPRNYLEWNPLL